MLLKFARHVDEIHNLLLRQVGNCYKIMFFHLKIVVEESCLFAAVLPPLNAEKHRPKSSSCSFRLLRYTYFFDLWRYYERKIVFLQKINDYCE